MANMNPKIYIPLFLVILSVFHTGQTQSVPLLIWSQNMQTPAGKPAFSSLVDLIGSNDILNNYATRRDKVSVVVFQQDNLDVEQFSENNAPFVSKLFEKPELNPILFTNALLSPDIYSFDENVDPEKQNENKNIIIYLPGNNLKANDKTIRTTIERFNESGPVIFMLTGKINDYLNVNERYTRDVNADPEVKSQIIQFPSTDPCIYFYSEKATLKKYKNDKTFDSSTYNKFSFDAVKNEKVKCLVEKEFGQVESVVLTLESGTDKSLDVTINFSFKKSYPWKIAEIATKTDDISLANKNFNLSTENLFSYSCQQAVFRLDITAQKTKEEYQYAELVFERFQIQPFVIKNSMYKFEKSFDCAVWFTLPVFSCLLVCLLLLVILYSGVRALMSITTPDRFENPKSGRSLIITNFEE